MNEKIQELIDRAAVAFGELNDSEGLAILDQAVNEIKELEEDSRFLNKLREAGVDNWPGYEHGFSDEEVED